MIILRLGSTSSALVETLDFQPESFNPSYDSWWLLSVIMVCIILDATLYANTGVLGKWVSRISKRWDYKLRN